MDDPFGFLRYRREAPRKQAARRRLRHWGEYVEVVPTAQAERQADRCMDCGIPFCHSHCPVHNLIPEWNELVYERRWRQAYEHLDSTNNFPEFTGRLCPAPCEHACTLRLNDQPVSIRDIELAVSEHAWEAGWVKPTPAAPPTGRRIAVVGSGPAGLACAQQLRRVGHEVDLYEKADRPGGLLRYGIPDFRLNKAILDRRLAQIRDEGVAFHTGIEVGVKLPVQSLQTTCDAVVLACGCEQPRDLDAPGRELAGIHFALDYLCQQNRRVAGAAIPERESLHARGLDVVVIGGGDTGGDCVGTGMRQGARSVVQVQYHNRPPAHADVLTHWPQPAPEYHRNDHDDEGADHLWGWDTAAFEGDGGRVRRVVLQGLRWQQDESGIWRKRRVAGRRRQLPAQLVLIAIGYAHPRHHGLVEELRPALGPRGRIAADDTDYRTSIRGVFACGDMRRGQSLLVWAIREGRQCARAVDQWLRSASDLPRV